MSSADVSYHFTLISNIKRDPFEQMSTPDENNKSMMGFGGALAAPSTAWQYDWNMLPLGQQMWEQHLASYKTFPPMQAPETYNLDGILKQLQSTGKGAGD